MSVEILVALLLYVAFKDCDDVTVTLSLEIELPMKKKGPPYQTDYVILMKETAKEPSYSTEVKTVVPVEFKIVKPCHCIEMLIYCPYIMRISKLDSILGCLMDGINDYMTFVSADDSVILNTIPNLLNCLVRS